jgi:nicotinamidase/pyrazinamidase
MAGTDRARAALVIVDVQNDFCPGGALGVLGGDEIVPVLSEYASRFSKAGLPIFATRDWHPEQTTHFQKWGGIWPPHCVAGTNGAAFHSGLKLPRETIIISKGTQPEGDSYSTFHGWDYDGLPFEDSLRRRGVHHLYIGGLATDYCVLFSTLDALSQGFAVTVLLDAVRGIDREPGDSERALRKMKEAGADTATLASIDAELGEARSAKASRPS